MMHSWYRAGVATLLVTMLAACSSDKVQKPAPLPEISRHAADSVWIGKQWERGVGNGNGEEFLRLRPSVGESALYVASRDGHIVALNKDTGAVIWSRWTAFPFTGAVASGYGLVAAGTAKGQLVLIDAATGKSRWWVDDLSAEVLSAPAIDENTVVAVCGDGRVYAYGRESGQRLWVHDTQVPALSLRGNAPPVIDNGVVYIATATGKIEAVQAADGLPLWDTRVASNLGRSDLDRITDVDGDMLVDDVSHVIYAAGFQSQMSAVDLADGHRLWQFDTSSFNGVAGAAGNVFAVDNTGTVYGVDALSGKSVWKQSALAFRVLGSPLVFGDNLLIGDKDGFVHVLSLVDGSIVGRFQQGSEPILALRADNDKLFVYSSDGRLGMWQRLPGPPPLVRLVKHGMNPWGQDLDRP